MKKLQTRRGRGAWGAWLLVALAACALCAGAAAQSGRRRTPQQSPTPQPSPEAAPEGESESESRGRPADLKGAALVSFVVMEQDETVFGADSMTKADVVESFTTRLGNSPSVSVTSAGRGTRSDARTRAKTEGEAFVVLLELEDEYGPSARAPRDIGRDDRNRTLTVRTSVYAPKTGAIKYMDTTHQRPVRQTVGIGGIGIPLPTRTIGRYPSQLELRQAARDAADRILARFHIAIPPDQP